MKDKIGNRPYLIISLEQNHKPMKFPWTLMAIMATGSLMVTPNPPSYASPAENVWTVHTEGIVKNRLEKIALPFDVQPSELVLDRIKMYVTAGRRDTEIIMGHSVLYFPIYEHYLHLYNLPMELKYLPIIESGMRPGVRSQAGAVGMWQLMHSTARHYGLTINEYIDERRDPYRSTEAAVRMLADLHKAFGDWALVLAAYNGGIGRVQKAIQYAGSKDFAEVKRYLPLETQRYVPYFTAAAYVATYYTEHGIQPRFPDRQLQDTRTLEVHQYLSFNEIAKATGLSYGVISKLNPAYLRGALPRSRKGVYLVLPAQAASVARRYLDEKAERDLSAIVPQNTFKYTHVVESGQDLQQLARAFQCSVEDIMMWNNLSTPKVVINQQLDLYLTKAVIFNRA